MKRSVLSVLVPPVAVCRYGCAGCCAAPIAVFWLTGITGLIYGFVFGGPLGLATVSWSTVGLGALLWGVAAVWSLIAVHTVDEHRCGHRPSRLCGPIAVAVDERDPFEEVRKVR